MTKEQILENTKKIVTAPSCWAGLKDAGNAWMDSIGKADENAKFDAYIAMLKECVTPIDGCIAFSTSDVCKNMFGEEGAKAMHDNSVKAKESGAKYCICDACTLGGEILDSLN